MPCAASGHARLGSRLCGLLHRWLEAELGSLLVQVLNSGLANGVLQEGEIRGRGSHMSAVAALTLS